MFVYDAFMRTHHLSATMLFHTTATKYYEYSLHRSTASTKPAPLIGDCIDSSKIKHAKRVAAYFYY